MRTRESEYAQAVEDIKRKFDNKADIAEKIVDLVIIKALLKFENDLTKERFLTLVIDYALNPKFLTKEDFTKSELEMLIKETKLNKRDVEIARLRYIESMAAEQIADKLLIDKRTIYNNLDEIKKKIQNTVMKCYGIK